MPFVPVAICICEVQALIQEMFSLTLKLACLLCLYIRKMNSFITHRPLRNRTNALALCAIKHRIFGEIITMCKSPYFDTALTKSILFRALLGGLNWTVYIYEVMHVGVSE